MILGPNLIFIQLVNGGYFSGESPNVFDGFSDGFSNGFSQP